jgi:voltage-gated potassium channel
MEKKDTNRELKNSSYELFILLISILSIFNLAFLIIPGFNPIVKGVVRIIDAFITVLFMGDFLFRFLTAKSKRDYFFKNWGWADLLASLPVQQLRIFRIFRILKVLRLLREFGLKNMLLEIRDNRAGSALYVVVFLVILVLEFGGIAIIYIESPDPAANITTPSDAVWWAFVTITTVGYGDQYPVTNTGRIIGMFVMILGVGLFGVLTGFLANSFLSPQMEKKKEIHGTSDARMQLEEFRKLIENQEKTSAALKTKFEILESLIQPEQME